MTSQGGGPRLARYLCELLKKLAGVKLITDGVFRIDTRRASRASKANDTGGNARQKPG